MIAELLSTNFYAAGKYTGNTVMFPRSTSTYIQGVVALGPIGARAFRHREASHGGVNLGRHV